LEAAETLARRGRRLDSALAVELACCPRESSIRLRNWSLDMLAAHADARLVLALTDRHPFAPGQEGARVLSRALDGDPGLVRRLLDRPWDDQRLGNETALPRALFWHADRQTVAVLRDALSGSPHAHVRANAACACGLAREPSAAPYLRRALGDESTSVRLQAALALARLGDTYASPAVARWLHDTQEPAPGSDLGEARFPEFRAEVREQYEQMGARIGDGNACPRALPPPYTLPREKVRESLLGALRNLGPEHAQDFYRRLASSAIGAERAQAAEQLGWALGRDWPASTAVLRHLSADPEFEVRIRATLGLVRAGDLFGWPALLALPRGDPITRMAARSACGSLDNRRTPLLVRATIEVVFRAKGLLGPWQ
jgi:hypothetical protein